MGFHQTSTEPILRIFKAKKAEKQKQQQRCPEHRDDLDGEDSDGDASSDSESSDEEPDDDQFMEFDSSDSDCAAAADKNNREMADEARVAVLEEMIDA